MLQALVFYTDSLDSTQLVQSLLKRKFIGEHYESSRFLVGNGFFNNLILLGCSPNLSLSPSEEDKPFTHVEIMQQERYFIGSNSRPPKCPKCQQRFKDWKANYNNFLMVTLCPKCQASLASTDWLLGKNMMRVKAGFIVWDVFENEAVPSESFMDFLAELTITPWYYGFYRQ